MATDQHSTSRRAIIKALAAAPILATASVVEAAATGGALTDRSSGMNSQAKIFDISPAARWERALTAYQRLRAEWLAHPYGRTPPDSPDYDRLEAEEGVLSHRTHRALDVVFRTAVPNYGSFLDKMEIFASEFEYATDGQFSHLLYDARRLT